jgi:phage-related protein
MENEKLKPVRWVGSSRKDVRTFPRSVRIEIGIALYAAQKDEADPSSKALREIVTPHIGDTWRMVYTVQIQDAVYVFHAFQKKSKTGVATPKKEIDLVRQRLAEAERDNRGRHN